MVHSRRRYVSILSGSCPINGKYRPLPSTTAFEPARFWTPVWGFWFAPLDPGIVLIGTYLSGDRASLHLDFVFDHGPTQVRPGVVHRMRLKHMAALSAESPSVGSLRATAQSAPVDNGRSGQSAGCLAKLEMFILLTPCVCHSP